MILRSTLLAVSLVTLLSVDAHAYCRSTTCAGECPRDVDGCKTSGAKLFWPGMCVGFSMDRAASEHIPLESAREVIQKGFVAWSDLECASGGIATIAFAMQPDVDCHVAEYIEGGPNANVILFQDYKWRYTGTANTLAKTTVTYDTETGEIFDADIEVNHAYNEYTVGDENVVYDLQSIATHEIGHFIGLDHTPDSLATMNAGYQQGTTELRSLESDDIDAACDAYPSTRQVTCDPRPRGGLAETCGNAQPEDEGEGCSVAPNEPKGGVVALAIGVFLLGAARRRRIEGNQRYPLRS